VGGGLEGCLSTIRWAIVVWNYISFVGGMSYVVLPLKNLRKPMIIERIIFQGPLQLRVGRV
jgi:surface polysaccharide O-acyltransferase-like enzyme